MVGGIVTIRFTTRWPWNPASPVIARLAGSRQWSHCFAIIDGTAYEAAMGQGCRVAPVAEAMVGVAAYRDMEVCVQDIEAAKAFGVAQDGKRYDYPGALGLPLMASENWGDDTSWWCSELVFMMVGAAGVWMLDRDEQHRVTPNDLHQCNYAKTDIVYLSKPLPVLRHFFDQRGQVMVRVAILTVLLLVLTGLALRRILPAAQVAYTAQCKDLTLSTSQTRPGTCSRHGGVRQWLK